MSIFDGWKSLLASQNIQAGGADFAYLGPVFKPVSQSISVLSKEINREIDLNTFTSSGDEYLNVDQQAIFAYLRIARGRPEERKVHFTYCEKLKASESGKYFGTTRNDGLFEVDVEKNGQKETQLLSLKPCSWCIGNYFGLPNKSDRPDIKKIQENFSYRDIAGEIGLTLNQVAWYSRLYAYTDKSWDQRSYEARKHARWTCEKCGVILDEEYRYFLHTHHLIGDRNFNHPANLMVCCIRCHAEEPAHESMKSFVQYRQFMKLLKANTFSFKKTLARSSPPQ